MHVKFWTYIVRKIWFTEESGFKPQLVRLRLDSGQIRGEPRQSSDGRIETKLASKLWCNNASSRAAPK